MKKLRAFCVAFCVVVCAFVLVGCADEKTSKTIIDYDYTNIKLNINDTLYVGDSYNIENYLTFSSSLEVVTFQCLSTNTDVIEFADGKTFVCKSVGSATIKVRTEVKDGTYVIATDNVEVEVEPEYYTSFMFEKNEVYVDASEKKASNKIITQGTSTFPIVVSSYPSGLIQYDTKTGDITFSGAGNCVVTAKVPYGRDNDKNILYHNYSFSFYAERYISGITFTGATGGSILLKEGEEGDFTISVSNAKTYTVAAPTITSNSDNITLDGYHYIANRAGTCTLTVSYETSHNVFTTSDYTLKIVKDPIDIDYTIYYDDNEHTGQMLQNTEYLIKLTGAFDNTSGADADWLFLDKAYLVSVSGVDGTVTKNGNDLDITFSTPNATGSLTIQIVYEKQTYSSRIYHVVTIECVVV